jgi:hypothetical protein
MALSLAIDFGNFIYKRFRNDNTIFDAGFLAGDSRFFYIQPAPMRNQDGTYGITYSIDAMNPIYTKLELTGSETAHRQKAKILLVDFSLEVFAKDYVKLQTITKKAIQVMEETPKGTFALNSLDNIEVLSIIFDNMSSDYNKQRRNYINDVSFKARIIN